MRTERNRPIALNESLSKNEEITTDYKITQAVVKLFRKHIGSENSIHWRNAFTEIIGIAPEKMDVFRRIYWWGLIKETLSRLRSENTLFVVYKGGRMFVLQTQEDLEYVHRRIDNSIQSLKNIRRNADEWVKKKKWRSL